MTWEAALVPVRRAIAAAADRRADAEVAEAEADAHRLLAHASAEAEEVLARARAEGARTGAEQAALVTARARRDAHRAVLAAREASRRELVDGVVEAVCALRADPRYPALRDRLTAECHARLGPAAHVREAEAGGVVAVAGSRHLDLSLPVLAARAAALADAADDPAGAS